MASACVFLTTSFQAQNTSACLPSSSLQDKQPNARAVVIAELTFEGDLHLAITDQQQIATSLKQPTYSGNPEGVTEELLERTRRAWQDRGYFAVQVRGDATVLTNSPVSERIAVTVRIIEGQQYRLGLITFKNNRAIRNSQGLRDLFPLKDGDIFSRAKIEKGLENLRYVYGEMGYINVTLVPNTRFNEQRHRISLEINVDEGRQFYVSSVDVLGLDENVFRKDLLLKPGDIYNRRLGELSIQKYASLLPTGAPFDSRIHLQLNQRAATVAITFDFRQCPVDQQNLR